jgi:fatty-acid desaturase
LATTHPVADSLETPIPTQPLQIMWTQAAVVSTTHLLALLALLPWFFSWTGVILAVIGHHVFGCLGMTLGYHRLLTHRGFTCPLWFERLLALLGTCCLQDSPARWVAVHRQHHQFSDEQADPHSPLVTAFWGHMGWLFADNREHNRVTFLDRYARDLLQDRFYMTLERNRVWLLVYIAHAVPFFLAGLFIGAATDGSWMAGVQFGLSLLVWGVFFRTVAVWHFTWSVNSLGHLFGYRNYETGDKSTNNWLVAILADGEGWHNNHHAEPRSAAHGHRWWEFDFTWMMIRLFEMVGLVKDVVRPQSWKQTTSDVPTKQPLAGGMQPPKILAPRAARKPL